MTQAQEIADGADPPSFEGGWRLGVLAPELPPESGGMSRLGSGLLDQLKDALELVVLADRDADPIPGTEFRAVLDRKPATAARAMAGAPVDAWLCLNAGLAPLAGETARPFFAYCHGNDFLAPWIDCGPRWIESLPRRVLRIRRRRLRQQASVEGLRTCRRVFTNSHHTAGRLKALGVPRDLLEVAFPGIEAGFFQSQRPRATALRLLTVSRLTRWGSRKNLDSVLEAVAELRQEMPIEYRIVGDGDDRARLEARSAELGVSDCVRFEGELDETALRTAYADSDLFLLVSRANETDVEGFGLVYLEAAAAGVPSLCSRAGGATDAVADGRSGFVVEGADCADIVAGIRRFLSEGSDAAVVREFARGFDWSRRATALAATIESWR